MFFLIMFYNLNYQWVIKSQNSQNLQELGESTVEHVARYQIKCGDLAIDEFLKIKNFPSSLTKSVFTWFTTLPPNSIYTWAQLERVFHENFF